MRNVEWGIENDPNLECGEANIICPVLVADEMRDVKKAQKVNSSLCLSRLKFSSIGSVSILC